MNQRAASLRPRTIDTIGSSDRTELTVFGLRVGCTCSDVKFWENCKPFNAPRRDDEYYCREKTRLSSSACSRWYPDQAYKRTSMAPSRTRQSNRYPHDRTNPMPSCTIPHETMQKPIKFLAPICRTNKLLGNWLEKDQKESQCAYVALAAIDMV